MFNIELIDNERSLSILVKYKTEVESETTIPLADISSKEYLENEINRIKYSLLKLVAMQLSNEGEELNVYN